LIVVAAEADEATTAGATVAVSIAAVSATATFLFIRRIAFLSLANWYFQSATTRDVQAAIPSRVWSENLFI
jgi:hypothetical protein